MNGRAAKQIRDMTDGNPLSAERVYRSFQSQTTKGVTIVADGARREYQAAKQAYRSFDEAGRAWFNRQSKGATNEPA